VNASIHSFCLLGAAVLIASSGFCAAGRTHSADEAANPFASFDKEMTEFMHARKVPGGALAVVKDGRLVYARGYGYADLEKRQVVKPDALFRIASVSKPITAVAVMQLIERQKLALDARVLPILRRKPGLVPGTIADPRLERITIRQLLHHTGGWDSGATFDPMFRSQDIAGEMGVPCPPGPETIITWMLRKGPLSHDPGTVYAYSNFGFCILGRVIEIESGLPYERYVQEYVLKPAGITQMRIGRSASSGPGEVHYYALNGDEADSVLPKGPRKVPWPYGGFYLEAMDSHGGWLASAVDLARFETALQDPAHSPLLREASIRRMYEAPPAPVSRTPQGALADYWYGCGWLVRPVGDKGANYWHNGSLPGTSTLLVRRWDGLSWVALFNQRSEDPKLPDGDIDGALHRAADAVKSWPSFDLFAKYK